MVNRTSKKEIPNRERVVEVHSSEETAQTTESELHQGSNLLTSVEHITLIFPNPSERGSELANASVKWHVFEPLSGVFFGTTES